MVMAYGSYKISSGNQCDRRRILLYSETVIGWKVCWKNVYVFLRWRRKVDYTELLQSLLQLVAIPIIGMLQFDDNLSDLATSRTTSIYLQYRLTERMIEEVYQYLPPFGYCQNVNESFQSMTNTGPFAPVFVMFLISEFTTFADFLLRVYKRHIF